MPLRCRQNVRNVLTIAFVAGAVWLCIAHPWVVGVAFVALYTLGMIFSVVADLTSPRKTEQPETTSVLSALIVGVLLGWWFGSGDDGGC